MKILFLNPGGHAQGGAERSLVGLIDGLTSRGHECSVILLARGDAATAFRAAGADVAGVLDVDLSTSPRHAPQRNVLTGAATAAPMACRLGLALRRMARSLGPDVIHSNGLRSHLLSPAFVGVAPIVWSMRDHAPGAVHRSALSVASRAAAAIATNSNFTASSLRTTTPTFVVGNPVADQPMRPSRLAARRSLGLPDERHVVAMAAHLDRSKGHDVLIEAIGTWPDHARPHLVIAGGDLYPSSAAYRRELEQRIRVLGAGGDITFAGNLDDMSTLYAAADVIVHPSRHPEGFGRVAAEAQLAGVPVVATALGAMTELIRHDDTGLLVPPDDVYALQRSIDAVLWPGATRSRLIARGRAAATRHHPAIHVDAVEHVYAHALGRDEDVASMIESVRPVEVSAVGR